MLLLSVSSLCIDPRTSSRRSTRRGSKGPTGGGSTGRGGSRQGHRQSSTRMTCSAALVSPDLHLVDDLLVVLHRTAARGWPLVGAAGEDEDDHGAQVT